MGRSLTGSCAKKKSGVGFHKKLGCNHLIGGGAPSNPPGKNGGKGKKRQGIVGGEEFSNEGGVVAAGKRERRVSFY